MAVDMFLKLTDVDGESQDKHHKDAIDVLAWSWGLSQSGSAHFGTGAGAGKANVQDLWITKWVNSSTVELIRHAITGKLFSQAQLIVRKAGELAVDYIVLDLRDVLVTSVSTGGSGGEDRLTENVSLNFGAFEVRYVQQEETGHALRPVEVGWSVVENRVTDLPAFQG